MKKLLQQWLQWSCDCVNQISEELISDTPRLVSYFTRLIDSTVAVDAIVAPSVHVLSKTFRCAETDVTNALYELFRQGYHYELNDFDTPILLRDPLRME